MDRNPSNGVDTALFTEWVRRYKNYVFAVILKILPPEVDAEDIAQEAFLKAYRAREGYQGGNPAVWLGRIAAHTAIDVLRQRADQPIDPDAIATEETIHPPLFAESRTPEEILLRSERREALQTALDGLPEEMRRTVELYYLEDRSYREIAALQGIGEKAVESRLYRARKRLREAIIDLGQGPDDEGRRSS